MRIVVTGATGNVGSAVVRCLREEPDVSEIVGLARRPSDPTGATSFAAVDVRHDDLDRHMAGADAVIHLAWLFQPTRDGRVTWEANVVGSERVFQAAARAGVRTLVSASSIGAYSAGPADGRSVDESWPTHSLPTSAYGREKAYVERLLDRLERDQPTMRVVRLRPAFIFQRSSATEQRRLFLGPFFPNALARPGTLPILPLPRGLRLQAVHSDDVADAYRRALLHDVRGAFNIAADPVLTAADVGRLLLARPVEIPRRLVRLVVAAAWHARLVPAAPTLLDLFLQLPQIDSGRARTELGWAPTKSSTDVIDEFLAGLQAGAGGSSPPLAPDGLARRIGELRFGVGARDR
jgi:UDP-glucose 4-epimerase